ncbi:MAG: isoprenylcysteine carboxylmethyltransferase family protein [Thermoplasmatales archaeon]|nr:MAG: isoprenylcysteine carboxylmethyltransferase family protein [Thermoplasmatales archaeon]
MSIIPAFELGWWNAWIFIIPLLAVHVVTGRVLESRDAEGQPSKFMMIIFLLLHFLPFIMPLNFDTYWFYVGLIVYLVGMVFVILAIIGFATTPKDKPVTTGIFRISRNPMYMGGIRIFLGIAIVSLSWFYAIIVLIWLILMIISISKEESQLLKKYGEEYREYMNRTPRWIGLPKK